MKPQHQQELQFKLIKAADAKPPQRFGRDVIEGSLLWKEFVAEINSIGPNQYGEFKGPKKKVQSMRRKVLKYLHDKKLKLSCYVVTNDDNTQSLYVVGQ